jgi:hypothetical protein
VIAALAATACVHDDLFQAQDYTSTQPLGSGAFHRVTYGPGADLFPSWLPGGDRVFYSFEPSDDPSRDRCVAAIPPEGGTRRPLPCFHHSAPDSVATSNWPVAAAGGQLAFVWEPIRPYPSLPFPDSALVFIENLATSGAARAAFRFPYVLPGVRVYDTATHLAWLSRDTLVAVGTTATVVRDCSVCPYRPVRLGRDVILIDLGRSPAALTIVPGTYPASSVAPGPSGNDIYYTLAGDARVFHRVLSTGDTAVTHDFGSAGIVRDVTVAGARLVAVVGGQVSYMVDLAVGPVQDDSGGFLHVVNLQAGVDSVLPDSGYLYRHAALGPAGDHLLAEGWRRGLADLWYFRIQ